ncbi:hypothetical protein AB3M81_07090 [Aeromicrobium sp. 179-A 4D2 NHS]
MNRKTVAKKCNLAHVYMVFVKVPKKSSKSSVVKKVRRTAEYKRSIRSAKHKVYGASTYRDKKVKGRTYTVLFTGQKKTVVKKPTPLPPPVVTPKPTTPTAVPTSEPTVTPTTPAPTTAPTTPAPTTEPTSEPTPPAAPVLVGDTQFYDELASKILNRVNVIGPFGWVWGDSCAQIEAARFAKTAADARSFDDVNLTPVCTGFNETAVFTAHTGPTVDPYPEMAAALVTDANLSPSAPGGPRNIADALEASSGKISLATFRTHDGSLFTAAVVTFDDPRYTTPERDTNFEQQIAASLAADAGTTPDDIRPADQCVTDEIDSRARSIATGQTNPDERQWTTTPLDCPNLYKQFFTYSKATTPADTITDLTSGTLNGDTGTNAADRINYALTHEEGRFAVRSYRDYRGNVWTYAAVILDDYPYKAPEAVPGFEAAVAEGLVARSLPRIQRDREDGFWTGGDPVWTESDECLAETADRWARTKATSQAKAKDIYAAYIPGFNKPNVIYGGMAETFASSGCATGYADGFVMASKASTPAAVVDEFMTKEGVQGRVDQIGRAYAKNWNGLGTVAYHLAHEYPVAVRSYRDFRGDVWTYAVFATTSGDTRRLDADQIDMMEDSIVSKVNDYRQALGKSRLPRRDCMDTVAGNSRLFMGTRVMWDGSFASYDPHTRMHRNKADIIADSTKQCGVPVASANEIVTQTTDTQNLRSPAWMEQQMSTWMGDRDPRAGWKNSPDHHTAMTDGSWTSLGVSVRDADKSGTYIVTIAFMK